MACAKAEFQQLKRNDAAASISADRCRRERVQDVERRAVRYNSVESAVLEDNGLVVVDTVPSVQC